jgi:hypothetical protein
MAACRPRSKPRSERAQERTSALTYLVLDRKLAFPLLSTLHHSNLKASSRYRHIARDRRGLRLGRSTGATETFGALATRLHVDGPPISCYGI